MLLGGLWHGASWTFVVWGAYHGLLLCAFRATDDLWNRVPALLRQLMMFGLVVIGWVFFRATSFTMAAGLLRTMFVPTSGFAGPQWGLASIAIAIAAVWAMAGPNAFEIETRTTWGRRLGLTAAFAATVALIVGSRSSPFLYFQF
jgi:alginate O-acetyltransferase complex protein AlgI